MAKAPKPPADTAPAPTADPELPPQVKEPGGGSVRARCMAECYVRKGRRRPGDIVVFPNREGVPPYFVVIE